MVSPKPLPTPRRTAPRSPFLAAGNTTFTMICQRVAPMASAASR